MNLESPLMCILIREASVLSSIYSDFTTQLLPSLSMSTKKKIQKYKCFLVHTMKVNVRV